MISGVPVRHQGPHVRSRELRRESAEGQGEGLGALAGGSESAGGTGGWGAWLLQSRECGDCKAVQAHLQSLRGWRPEGQAGQSSSNGKGTDNILLQ